MAVFSTSLQPTTFPTQKLSRIMLPVCCALGLALTGCASRNMPTTGPVYVKGVPSYYIVQSGDTLSKIATRYGLDYRRIGALNGLDSNYTIYPGQRLILNRSGQTTVAARPAPRPSAPVYVQSQPPVTRPIAIAPPSVPVVTQQRWVRPVTGQLLRPFNQAAGITGMWFGGQQGSPVVAAQAGTVLYVGSDLPEYGKLVMIQHSNDYISAYAHLDSFNVQEKQIVQAGQRIGGIGFVPALKQPALEFQIRYRGNPIDPSSFVK